jgi:hypothetical protein
MPSGMREYKSYSVPSGDFSFIGFLLQRPFFEVFSTKALPRGWFSGGMCLRDWQKSGKRGLAPFATEFGGLRQI